MRLIEVSQDLFRTIQIWLCACLLQIGTIKLISFLVGQYLLPNERILAWTNQFSVQHFFQFLKSEIFVGILMAAIFFMLLLKKQVNVKFWIVSLVFISISLGLGFALKDTVHILFLLATCVPICGYATIRLGRPEIEGRDFHNMGGEYYRGARLIKGERSSKAFSTLAQGEGKKGINLFPGLPFVFQRESEHFLLTGSPGAGKTQIIHSWAEEVYKRGDKAIIWDVKGTFIQSFVGCPGVDLLAVWDKRSFVWSPQMDIKNYLDCQQMAEIIIPRNLREIQQHFPDSARQVLEAILIYLDAKGSPWGWDDLWKIISQGRKELSLLLASFPEGKGASHLIAGDNSRSSAEDVYSTLMAQTQRTIRWFAKGWPKGGQSLRKWVHSNSKFLILGGIPERTELAHATANMAIPLIVNEILSLEDDPNRRIWLFLDELATLGKIEALLQAFSLGRSKGLCVVAGIQDMGKIEHHYNHMLAKSISNTFGTKIFLRCSDVETSHWASKVLGDQDIFERQVSVGESSQGLFSKSVKTKTEQNILRTRVVFTPTQIANFKNLEGILQVSGWPLLMFRWVYLSIGQNAKLLEPAHWVSQKASLSDLGQSETPNEPWRLDP